MGTLSETGKAPVGTAGRLHPIGDAAGRLGVHPRTLMAYEKIGLVKPARRSNRRMYSDNELRWLGCVQLMNREGGISLQGLSTLLRFVPCWAILSQMEQGVRGDCSPAAHPAGACLERVRDAYAGHAPATCRSCGIYRENRARARIALGPETSAETPRS